MNYINTNEDLKKVYGKNDCSYIKLTIPTVNVKLLLENLDMFSNYTVDELLSITHYSGYLLIENNDQFISKLEFNKIIKNNANIEEKVLSGGMAIDYLINKLTDENIKESLKNIIVNKICVTINHDLVHYEKILNRNLRIKKLTELSAPSLILNNEKLLLQELIGELLGYLNMEVKYNEEDC